MDKNENKNNMFEKIGEHKKEILIGAGALGCAALAFAAGYKFELKNTIRFRMSDDKAFETYKGFFRPTCVTGACVCQNATKEQLQEYFNKCMNSDSGEHLYGMILEAYPKKD